MNKIYKILVNITGKDKTYKIPFDNREYRNYHEKRNNKKENNIKPSQRS